MAVEGDLRFLSHHDTLRAIERTLARGRIPVRYSQGFNPRPTMSLSCPRPVGVASQDDLLVLSLETDVTALELARMLNQQAPRGMSFSNARTFDGPPPQPCRMIYQTPLGASGSPHVAESLGELQSLDAWPVSRPAKDPHDAPKTIDLRPLVQQLEITNDSLLMTLTPQDQSWARPAEVLRLVGLDERQDLAATTRTSVEYRWGKPTQTSPPVAQTE